MPEDTVLAVEGLNCFYGPSHIIQDLSLHLGHECLALLGRNGVGKTTLVRALMGLKPPAARGSIYYQGREILGTPAQQLARAGIGYVPQGRRLFPSLTVREHLELTQRRESGPDAWTIEAVYDLFPSLAARYKAFGDQLSGGERSMLALARALVTNPSLLIMDEPTEGLAPAVVDSVSEELRKLTAGGVVILLVEQNLRAAARAADRICFMDQGRLVYEGPSAEVAADKDLVSRYMGVAG